MALASCTINAGYTYPCRTNNGGVKAIYVAVYNDTLTTFTTLANQVITITGSPNYWTITQRIEQASFTQTLAQSIENGTTFWEQSVTMVIEQVDPTLDDWTNILCQGLWRIIVLDNNGTYWLIGKKNGAYVTVGDAGVHKAYGDGNKATLTFTAKEPVKAIVVSSDAAATVIR